MAKKLTQILILCMTVFGGCNGINQTSDPSDWIYGKWLSIGCSESIVVQQKEKEPPEKHVLVFERSGRLTRFSASKGWLRIYIDFSIMGKILIAKGEDQSLELGRLCKDGNLILSFCKNRHVLYQRLVDDAVVEELDLRGELSMLKNDAMNDTSMKSIEL